MSVRILGLEHWLNGLSVVCNEFVDIDITALVGVDLVEYLAQLFLHLR